MFYLLSSQSWLQGSKKHDEIERKKKKSRTLAALLRKSSTPMRLKEMKKQVPAWIIVVFLFALVFCLFAIYKVFIYGRGYNTPQTPTESINLLTPENTEVITINSGALADETSAVNQASWAVSGETTGNQQNQVRVVSTQHIDRTADSNLIQDFYQYLVSENFTEMNRLVHAPLKNSTTRDSHWNKKNISIFTRNLVGDLNLNSIFLIPGSVNDAKNTRQYSYTLSYAISWNQHFNEDWKVTLINLSGDKTQISEIMCTTKWCSKSPFFWPQNYNLK